MTSDFDEARDMLAAAYGDRRAVLLGDPERFSYRSRVVEVDGLRMDHFHYGSQVESWYHPFENTLAVGRLRAGVLSVDDGRGERLLGAEDLVWFPPDRPQHLVVEDVSVDIARLDMTTLGRVAAETSGIDPAALRFHAAAPVSEESVRYWAATRRWIAHHVLGDESVAAEALIRVEALTALARATLLTVPNTALDVLTDRPAPAPAAAEPGVVRRAVEFMDANAQRDITITQIADASRIGPRGLQATFRKHRDQTPLEYLRRVRMAGAHRDLQAADPTRGDTVAAIAARWGFPHPGRFSVSYRRTYGDSPSTTLGR